VRKAKILGLVRILNRFFANLDEHFWRGSARWNTASAVWDDRLTEIYDLFSQLSTDSFYDHTMIESIAGGVEKATDRGQARPRTRLAQARYPTIIGERGTREVRSQQEIVSERLSGGRTRAASPNLIEESSQYFIRRNYRRGLKAWNARLRLIRKIAKWESSRQITTEFEIC